MTRAVDEDALQLPSPVTVQAALRTVTERFALEMSAPTSSVPRWSHFEWRTARAAAAMHGITGILAGRLRWQGPEGWREFLTEQRAHIAQRHVRIRELTQATGERLRACGIPAQALKGAALHEVGLYLAGERPMADLDLLIRAQDVGRTTQVLEDLGLRESHHTFKHRVFVARDGVTPGRLGEHAANDIKVELHERICEPLPQRLIDVSQFVQARAPRPGLNPYPSLAALMVHLLLHAAGDMAGRSLRLIQLHDIALLAHRLTAEDWQEVVERGSWWAWPPLSMAERYYGELAPSAVMARAREACSAILRRVYARQLLSDVSMSRLWVEAFPGIEWTQSIGEAADYVWRRLAPSAELRERRRFALQTEPSLTGSDWGAISQRRRILRFLTRRAARPWPLYNVRAALAQRRCAGRARSDMATAPADSGRLGDTPDRDYSRKLRMFNALAEPELRAAIDSLDLVPGMRVLDAGCGTGETLGWLAAAVAPTGFALGIDLSTHHLTAARGALPRDTPLLQADLLRTPIAAASFDLVWSVNTVHHLRDPTAGARALTDLLRAGGRLALGQSSLLPDMYFAWDARLERSLTEAVHAYYRDRYGLSEQGLTAVRGLLGLLQDAGLCRISVRTFVIERFAPLDACAHAWLLEAVFRGTWGERLRPYLTQADHEALTRLCDPQHRDFALRRPDFHFLQTFTLAVGERPWPQQPGP